MQRGTRFGGLVWGGVLLLGGSGTFMVLFGVVALSMTTGILEWGDARNLWPLILVAIGASMVLRSRSSS